MDWNKIKTEYITTSISYRKLAEKYNKPFNTLQCRAKKEKWVELRKQHQDKIVTEIITKDVENQIDRYTRILSVTDELLDKIEQSIKELDMHMATETHKTKIIEYNNNDRPDKQTKEVVDEVIEVKSYQSIIDRSGLKQIASAIRDLKEVQMLKSEIDQKEQEARIAKLKRETEVYQDQNSDILITIKGGSEEWQN